jgi:hypothetical protein
MQRRVSAIAFPLVLATYMPFCVQDIRPVLQPAEMPVATLWREPDDVTRRNLFVGEWGAGRAPDPQATYAFVERKHSGVNPGLTVRDPNGRRWSVKQAPHYGEPAEGPIEIALSRVLSAVGYHQPPIYYLPSFELEDDWGVHVEPGGRFRRHEETLEDVGIWSWQQNPFVGTTPYQGLLAILMMFCSSDLKNSNNTIYEYRASGHKERWYVVRDLGTALGETARFAPRRGNPDVFEQQRFVLGVRNGFVLFDYRGRHEELVLQRIRPDDVRWAADRLAALSLEQWRDAFRAGAFSPATAERFIRQLHRNIEIGRHVTDETNPASEGR